MRASLLLILWLLAAPAWAFDTVQGKPEIVPASDFEKALLVGGDRYPLPTEPYYAGIVAQVNGWLLISLSQGGNACAAHYVWAVVSLGSVEFSDVFGTCHDEITVEPNGAEARVIVPSTSTGVGPIAFDFDGQNISETPLGLQQIGWSMGQPGTFWLDRYLFDALNAAELAQPLAAILTPQELEIVNTNAHMASPFEVQGDWVVGTACQKYGCAENKVGLAFSRDGARLLIAYSSSGGPPAMFGDLGGTIPPALMDIHAQGQ